MNQVSEPLFPVTDPQAVATLRARWRRGERQAAVELLRPYERPVYSLVRSLVVVEGEAVELTLQVFTAAWRGGAEQELGKALLPWLLGLLVARVQAYGRRERRGQHLDERLLLLLNEALRDRPTILTATYGQSLERLALRATRARALLGAGVVTSVAFAEPPPLDLLALAEARASSAGPVRLERRALVMPVLGTAVLAAALIWFFTARPGLRQPAAGEAIEVSALTGEAWQGLAAAPRALGVGRQLASGERVATGVGATLELVRPRLRIVLAGETVVELLALDEAGAAVRLRAGELAITAEGLPVLVELGDAPRRVELETAVVRLTAAPRVVVERGRALLREGRRVLILTAEGESTFDGAAVP